MAFIISFVASISTLIGFLFVFIPHFEKKIIPICLSFSSGVMFFISIYDLLPNSYLNISNNYSFVFSLILILLFFSIGYIFSMFISNLFPEDNYLYKVGFISMIAIILHNIPEGIVTFITSSYDLKIGICLGIAITLHNIPEGVSISLPIYYSTNSRRKAFLYTFISGFSEIIGSFISYLFIHSYNYLFMGFLYSFISGIMIHLSLNILFPSSLKYNRLFLSVFSFILGVLVIYISIIIIQ